MAGLQLNKRFQKAVSSPNVAQTPAQRQAPPGRTELTYQWEPKEPTEEIAS